MLSRITESKAYKWVSSKAQLVASKLEALEAKLDQPTREIGQIHTPVLFFAVAGAAVTFNYSNQNTLLLDSLARYSLKGMKYIINNLPEPEKLYKGYRNSLFVFQGIIVPVGFALNPELDPILKVFASGVAIMVTRALLFPTKEEQIQLQSDQRIFARSFNGFKKSINDLDYDGSQDNIVTHNHFSNVFKSLVASLEPRTTIRGDLFVSNYMVAVQQFILSNQSIPRPPSTHLDITRLLVINNQKISERSVNEIAKLFLAPKEEVKYLTDARDVNIQSDYEEVNNSDDDYEIVNIPRLQKF